MIPSLKSIGNQCFYGCESLFGSLILSSCENLTYIGDEAFYGCFSFQSEVSFPQKLEYIGNRSFASLKITGSIYIPDSVKTIGSQAFFNCDKLSGSLYIGRNCESIGESAFSMCTSLSGSINIECNINKIEAYTFYGCSSLKGSLIIASHIERIGEYAFMGCSGFGGSLILPDSLQTISQYAFASCTNLTGTLIIPDKVKIIKTSAFFGCIGFEEIKFKSSSVNVESFAFSKLSNKCFDNVPESFKNNEPEIYNSDNFDGKILSGSILNLQCSVFYGLDNFCYILSIFAGSGGCAVVLVFITNFATTFYKNVKHMESIFKKIIHKESERCEGNEGSEGEKDEKESIQKIINQINSYLSIESQHPKFKVTKSEAQRALNNSIESEWETMFTHNKEYILSHAFNEIHFYKKCTWLKRKCHKTQYEYSDDEQIISMATLV